MNFVYLLRHKELFPSAIGVKHREFEQILRKFTPVLRKAERRRFFSKDRKRAPGGGRKATLETDRQKLFFILFYYKVYPTFRLAQILFCFDKRNVQLWKEYLEEVLEDALGYQLNLPVIQASHLGDVIKICPGLSEFIVDATERPVYRSRDKDTQEFFYSGKKKRHTVKNNCYVHPRSKKLIGISKTVEGKRHDKKLTEDDPLWSTIPPSAVGLGDTGYQGLEPKYKTTKFIRPMKKPKGRKLSIEEKCNNKKISQVRVRGEYPFAYLKHFNILSHTFRNKFTKKDMSKVDNPFKIIACIYNFNLSYR